MKKSLILLLLLFYSCSTYKGLDSQKRFLLNENTDDKYYLIEFINSNQNILGEVPTLIINTKNGMLLVRSDNKKTKKLNLKKSNIKRITIIEKEKAPQIYGSAGKNGVINIYEY